MRGWEAGRRDRNSEPVVIPRPIAVLVRLALKHASVRRELGIPSEGRAVKATSSIASSPKRRLPLRHCCNGVATTRKTKRLLSLTH